MIPSPFPNPKREKELEEKWKKAKDLNTNDEKVFKGLVASYLKKRMETPLPLTEMEIRAVVAGIGMGLIACEQIPTLRTSESLNKVTLECIEEIMECMDE